MGNPYLMETITYLISHFTLHRRSKSIALLLLLLSLAQASFLYAL